MGKENKHIKQLITIHTDKSENGLKKGWKMK